MTDTHLTTREQENWVLGERTPTAALHLTRCVECRTAVSRMEQGIAQFRQSSLVWSEECAEKRLAAELPLHAAPRPGVFSAHWAPGCAAAALAVTLGLISLHPRSPAGPAHGGVRATTATLSDDALLEKIDQQVSDSVPWSMQPLAYSAGSEGGSTRTDTP